MSCGLVSCLNLCGSWFGIVETIDFASANGLKANVIVDGVVNLESKGWKKDE